MGAEFRVLHLRSSAGLYGAEYVILGLLPALAARGIDSTLLCLHNPHTPTQALRDKALALGVPTQVLPCRGRFDFATVGALRTLLAQHPDTILHVHDYKSALNAWLARGRRPVPIVATSHGQFPTTLSLQLYHRLELSLMRRFERVCIVAADMRPVLMRAGVAAAKITLIENGIDTRRFTPDAAPLARSALGVRDDALVFGAAMRLTEQKNPLQLVDAFARVAAALPRAALVIAGAGELRDAIAARARELGVGDRVRLPGALADLERFYAAIDVFVLPSRYEGLPLALLEAMAVQRPVVATDVGQVREALDGTGYAPVAAGDAQALAAAMRAAATQPEPAVRLRERVVERYSVDRMATDYAAVYDGVWRSRERVAA